MKKVCHYIMGLLIAICFTACKDMENTYKDFIVPGGLVYSGKPINPVVHPGYNRVMISWVKGSDPNVAVAKVFWNNYTDSLNVTIPENRDSIEILINNLPEKYYSFFIKTYDDEGHASIATEVMGSVYGEKYRSTLLPRPIISSEMNEDGKIAITWGAADVTGGAFAVDVFYTLAGETYKQRFNVEDLTSEWGGDMDVDYYYQTVFHPNPLAIDTLYTDPEPLKIAKVDVTNKYMKNIKRPFLYSSWDGSRYGILQDWTTNDAVKNKAGGNGGYDNLNNGGCIGAEQWTTDPAIVNGKIYQTFTIDPGRYQFTFLFGGPDNAIGNSGNDPRYLVVAAGNTLPDIANITSALASASLVGIAASTTATGSKTIEFVVDGPTEVSMGLLMNFTSTRQNIRGSQFQLVKMN